MQADTVMLNPGSTSEIIIALIHSTFVVRCCLNSRTSSYLATHLCPETAPSRGGCLLQTPEGKHLNLPCVFILEFQAQVQRRISSGWPWQVTISSVLVFLQILLTDGAVSGVVDTATGDLPSRALAGNHL